MAQLHLACGFVTGQTHPTLLQTPRTAPQRATRLVHYLVLLLLLLLGTPPPASAQPKRSAFQVLRSLNLNTFADSAASILPSIRDPNWSGTLLAPTDAAFRALAGEHNIDWGQIRGSSTFNRIVNYHIVNGQQLTSNRLTHAASVSTRSGALVIDRQANPSAVVFRGFDSAATATKVDLWGGNTVIHVIDTILYPNFNPIPGCKSVMDVASAENCQDFYRLVFYSEYFNNLNKDSWQGTVFMPTNPALKLSSGISKSTAKKMVQAYFLGGPPQTFWWIIAGQRITTQAGASYTVSRSGAKGRILLRTGNRNINIVKSVTTCNAVVHIINDVLS